MSFLFTKSTSQLEKEKRLKRQICMMYPSLVSWCNKIRFEWYVNYFLIFIYVTLSRSCMMRIFIIFGKEILNKKTYSKLWISIKGSDHIFILFGINVFYKMSYFSKSIFFKNDLLWLIKTSKWNKIVFNSFHIAF